MATMYWTELKTKHISKAHIFQTNMQRKNITTEEKKSERKILLRETNIHKQHIEMGSKRRNENND